MSVGSRVARVVVGGWWGLGVGFKSPGVNICVVTEFEVEVDGARVSLVVGASVVLLIWLCGCVVQPWVSVVVMVVSHRRIHCSSALVHSCSQNMCGHRRMQSTSPMLQWEWQSCRLNVAPRAVLIRVSSTREMMDFISVCVTRHLQRASDFLISSVYNLLFLSSLYVFFFFYEKPYSENFQYLLF